MKLRVACLGIIALFLIGCEDDAPTSAIDCAALTQSMSDAGATYTDAAGAGTATKADCDAWVAAIQAYVDGGCDSGGYYPQTTIDEMATGCATAFPE